MRPGGQGKKGKRFERKVAGKLREAMPGAEVKRGLQARGGEEAPDVDCPYFWVECEHAKGSGIRRKLRQAVRDAAKGRTPVAVVKRDREAATVTMLFDDWLELVHEWWVRR